MCPVGILFIIFPLNLINPHSVMNLEISIKHIITDQRGAGGGWRGLLTAAQGVWLCGAIWLDPGPGAGWGSGAVLGPHLFPGRSRVTRGVGAPLGVTLTSLAHRAGDSSLPTPPAGLGGVEWVRTDPWIPPPSQEEAVSQLVWMMWQRVRMDPQSDPSETQFGELAGQIYIYTSPSSFPGEGNGNPL